MPIVDVEERCIRLYEESKCAREQESARERKRAREQERVSERVNLISEN